MREIIQLHLGQSGIQIGNAIWDLLCQEHQISHDGSINQTISKKGIEQYADQSNLQVFFTESQSKYYVPRAYFIDEDPTTINQIKRSQYRNIYHPNSLGLIKQEIGGESNIKDNIQTTKNIQMIDQIQKLLEQCDSVSAIVMYHSLSGGFGSTISRNILDILKNETAKTTFLTYSILPSKNDLIVSPYNACFALKSLTEYSDFNILLQNSALHKISEKIIEFPNYTNLNHMIAQTFASITSQIRFKGRNFTDFNSIQSNLVPTPREQFLWTSYTPWQSKDSSLKPDIQNMTKSLFTSTNAYLDFNRLTHRYIGSNIFYRGDCPYIEVKDAIKIQKESTVIRFADERPKSFQISFSSNQSINLPQYGFGNTNKSACMLANSTAALKHFKQIHKDFSKLYSKRAFVHWYVGGGLEEGNFSESLEDLNKTIEVYKKLHGDGRPIEDDQDDIEIVEDKKKQKVQSKQQQNKKQQQNTKVTQSNNNVQQTNKPQNNNKQQDQQRIVDDRQQQSISRQQSTQQQNQPQAQAVKPQRIDDDPDQI